MIQPSDKGFGARESEGVSALTKSGLGLDMGDLNSSVALALGPGARIASDPADLGMVFVGNTLPQRVQDMPEKEPLRHTSAGSCRIESGQIVSGDLKIHVRLSGRTTADAITAFATAGLRYHTPRLDLLWRDPGHKVYPQRRSE